MATVSSCKKDRADFTTNGRTAVLLIKQARIFVSGAFADKRWHQACYQQIVNMLSYKVSH
jgi:hypothetical protein